MAHAEQTATAIEESEDFPLENFYRPSVGLTVRICDLIDTLEANANRGIEIKERSELEEAGPPSYEADLSSSPEEIVIQQRLIVEELDGCLIDAAETEVARQGKKISIEQVVTEGMSDALGMENTEAVLLELVAEFQNWLDSTGCYTAGWGNIISAQAGYMYLQAFEYADEVGEPDFTFTRPHQGGQVKNTPSLIGRIAAAMAAKLGV